MTTKILVTGGAGYLGSVIVPVLLAEGYEVKVLDNFMFKQNSLLECCANEHFSVVRGDCRDKATMKEVMKNADIIIPLAALVGAPLCKIDPIATQTTNYDAIKLLLSLRSRGQAILYPCTNSGYGIGEKDKFCTEETPLKPISLYGVTKVESEKAILEAGNAISFRLATVFGTSPRMRVDLLVNDFVYRAVTDRVVVVFEGHFKRNYIHIRDVASAFLHGIKNFDRMKNEPYNVGLSDANLSKLELCAEIKKQIPGFIYMEAPIGEDPDKRDYIVSNEKIESTGFKPAHSLDKGIRELIKCYTIIRNARYSNV
ncbi:NAD-dependent epimerase/dehydratase [Pelotomaculum isophthalicicum JI]|uniref:NAD-dependent epimerase/dehydratase n=1 Tax=Pelotomaculum isophthalicicum JI TaxID=947010 RepID=A0A9X4H5T8_9FIRM|nr:NAD-dependent epimerase/dehydratase [Pelotomaculum isophthalicicum]MDF9407904.1 NAD-dependent epimerase/dehydratase [Pelotomaculum isophthalicicum JI]